MDRYHIALFVHILAFVVASSASAVTKLAAGRRARARTVGDALDWHDVLTSTSKLFPICIAALVATGAYMLSFGQPGVWTAGFAVAGYVGVVALFASGIFLGRKGAALRQVLATMAQQGADRPAPRLVPPAIVMALPPINTGIALGVAFDMVTKPASVLAALGIVALGAAVFGGLALRSKPAAASAPALVRAA